MHKNISFVGHIRLFVAIALFSLLALLIQSYTTVFAASTVTITSTGASKITITYSFEDASKYRISVNKSQNGLSMASNAIVKSGLSGSGSVEITGLSPSTQYSIATNKDLGGGKFEVKPAVAAKSVTTKATDAPVQSGGSSGGGTQCPAGQKWGKAPDGGFSCIGSATTVTQDQCRRMGEVWANGKCGAGTATSASQYEACIARGGPEYACSPLSKTPGSATTPTTTPNTGGSTTQQPNTPANGGNQGLDVTAPNTTVIPPGGSEVLYEGETRVASTKCVDDAGNEVKGLGCLFQTYINPFIKLLSGAIGVIVVLMVVVGGVQYSSAGSDPQKVAEARKKITNALLALVTYIFIFALLNWLVPGGII